MKAVPERDWNVSTTCTVLILHKTVLLTTTALPMKSFCGVGEAFISDLAYQHFKCSQMSNGYNKELLLPDDFTISGETTHSHTTEPSSVEPCEKTELGKLFQLRHSDRCHQSAPSSCCASLSVKLLRPQLRPLPLFVFQQRG
jgi:hypothetical protein